MPALHSTQCSSSLPFPFPPTVCSSSTAPANACERTDAVNACDLESSRPLLLPSQRLRHPRQGSPRIGKAPAGTLRLSRRPRETAAHDAQKASAARACLLPRCIALARQWHHVVVRLGTLLGAHACLLGVSCPALALSVLGAAGPLRVLIPGARVLDTANLSLP